MTCTLPTPQVYAVEQDEVMSGICARVTADIAAIQVLHCSSAEFDISETHVDVIVTETLDSIGIGEGVVESCYDLAYRSNNTRLQFIPSKIELLGFLVHSETLHR